MDHFRLIAPIYDRVMAPPDVGRLQGLLDLPAAGKLLDVGGGTGRVAQALRGLVDEAVVLDESHRMLEQALLKGLTVVQGQAERLPFADGTFARVLVVDAFHHLADQGQAAAELLRVLAPGGRLVVEEPNVEQAAVRVLAFAERVALMRSRFRTPAQVQEMLEAAGARVSLYREGRTFWAVACKPSAAGNEG